MHVAFYITSHNMFEMSFFLCLRLLISISFNLSLYTTASGAKILFIPAMVSPSHKMTILPWADKLAERGHDVTMWAAALRPEKYLTKLAKSDVFVVDVRDKQILESFVWENSTYGGHMIWSYEWSNGHTSSILTYKLLMPMVHEVLGNPVYRSKLDAIVNQKWDLIILDEAFNPLGFLVALLNKAPVAIFCTTIFSHYAAHFAGIPNPPSHIPPIAVVQSLTDRMSFLQRIHSSIQRTLSIAYEELMMHLITQEIRQHFPNLPNIRQARTDPEFIFVNSYRAVDFSRSLPPNVIYIGGIHLKEPDNVTQADVLEFAQSAKRGFILVSMGHVVKWDNAPPNTKAAFVEGFSNLSSDYHIIWQYSGKEPQNLPSHVRTFRWIPQVNLLAHPQLKLFVTHCGGHGIMEAAYYGVPILGIPFLADQYDNAARFLAKRSGKRLSKTHLSADLIKATIMEIIEDPSFSANAKLLSAVVRDEEESPLNRAVFWTEFAVQHAGMNHLKSNAQKLNILQYYMVDIVALVLVVLYMVYCVLRYLLTLWRGRMVVRKRKAE